MHSFEGTRRVLVDELQTISLNLNPIDPKPKPQTAYFFKDLYIEITIRNPKKAQVHPKP